MKQYIKLIILICQHYRLPTQPNFFNIFSAQSCSCLPSFLLEHSIYPNPVVYVKVIFKPIFLNFLKFRLFRCINQGRPFYLISFGVSLATLLCNHHNKHNNAKSSIIIQIQYERIGKSKAENFDINDGDARKKYFHTENNDWGIFLLMKMNK